MATRRSSSGGGDKKPADKPLTLKLGDLKHTAKGWSVEVSVHFKSTDKLVDKLTHADNPDLREIVFLTEGGDKPVKTKDKKPVLLEHSSGDAKATLVFEKGGDYQLYVKRKSGGEESDKIAIKIPKTDEAKAAKIMPREIVFGTHCMVNIQVLSKGDTPVKGVKVQISDAKEGLKERKTDAKGFCVYEFDFDPADQKRKMLLQVPGTHVELPFTVYF